MNFNKNDRLTPLWQDRDIRFDVNSRDLLMRNGEKKFRLFNCVEDTKGNSGDYGQIILSNLRLIWQSKTKTRINLTIGFNCISTISKKALHSKLRGTYNALHLMCKVNSTRYEFIFAQFNSSLTEPINLVGEQSDLIYWVTIICKAYSESKLFRDLKLRSALLNTSKQLKILPNEQIYNKIQGVWNLSSDQGNLGTMHLTNVRIVWVANLNEMFNLSLPYSQVNSIKIRESKFGMALVIESSETSGGYVLGFRIDPPELLHQVYDELVNLFNVHGSKPDYGVEKLMNKQQLNQLANSDQSIIKEEIKSAKFDENEKNEEDNFLDESDNHLSADVIAAYLTDDSQINSNNGLNVEYCEELGLSIEPIKHGYTLKELWNVVMN